MKYVQPKTVTFMWVVLCDAPGQPVERYGCNVEAGVSKTGKPLLRVVSSPDHPGLARMILKDDTYTVCKGMFMSVWNQLRKHDEKRKSEGCRSTGRTGGI